jgi:hypothetical protein
MKVHVEPVVRMEVELLDHEGDPVWTGEFARRNAAMAALREAISSDVADFTINRCVASLSSQWKALNHTVRTPTLLSKTSLSSRGVNALQHWGINYAEEAAKTPVASLLRVKNFGRKSLVELMQLLSDLGIPHIDEEKVQRSKDILSDIIHSLAAPDRKLVVSLIERLSGRVVADRPL